MKAKAIIIFTALSVVSLAQTKEERKVDSFSSIEAGSAIKVIINIGDKESVTFETDAETMKNLKAEVHSGKLELSSKGEISCRSQVVAWVTAKQIKGIEANGAASVEVKGVITGNEINLEASGAASIKAEVKAKEIETEVSGAGKIIVSGTAEKLEAKTSGAGNLNAGSLKAAVVEVSASGAGSACVHASEKLEAHASGAGSVHYGGDPKSKSLHAGTAGRISKS